MKFIKHCDLAQHYLGLLAYKTDDADDAVSSLTQPHYPNIARNFNLHASHLWNAI